MICVTYKNMKEWIYNQQCLHVMHIYFKVFSNKATCKQRAANKNKIKTKYRKMLVYSEFTVKLSPEWASLFAP